MTHGEGAPDYDRGYLRVPLSVWSALYCQAPLTRRQLQIASCIIRESWGWQTKEGRVYLWTRPLSARQLSAATGLATDHLRRDLRDLVARGILRERERRYQLVPDPKLWKTRSTRAPKMRREGAETAVSTAKSALPPSVLKKANREQRNVAVRPKSELSPLADNSAAPAPFSSGQPERATVSRQPGSTPEIANHLARLIEAFVGPLPVAQAEAVRDWIRHAGVVLVWDTLEPSFQRGRRATRQQLRKLLAEQTSRQGEGAAPPPNVAAHG